MQVKVSSSTGKKVDHQGIRVQLLGQIELLNNRGNFHDFLGLGMPPRLAICMFTAFKLEHAGSTNDCCVDSASWLSILQVT